MVKRLENLFEIEWNETKNTLLKEQRNVCFEDVLFAVEGEKVLDIVKNSSNNHDTQYCLIVEISDYAYVVSFVENGEKFFLKTIFPSKRDKKVHRRQK